MNAPPTIDATARETALSARCLGTQLAVPECSCASCLERLIQTHAPAVLAGASAQPAFS
jgi:hypothetical protein